LYRRKRKATKAQRLNNGCGRRGKPQRFSLRAPAERGAEEYLQTDCTEMRDSARIKDQILPAARQKCFGEMLRGRQIQPRGQNDRFRHDNVPVSVSSGCRTLILFRSLMR
jgi:hypothetical protein